MKTKDLPLQVQVPQGAMNLAGNEIADYVETLLFCTHPQLGPEWVSLVRRECHGTLSERIQALANRAERSIHHVKPSVSALYGQSEGVILSVDLVVGEHRDPLVSAKLFTTMAKAWEAARDLSLLLEQLLGWDAEAALPRVLTQLGLRCSRLQAYHHQTVRISFHDDAEGLVFEHEGRRFCVPLPSEPHWRREQRSQLLAEFQAFVLHTCVQMEERTEDLAAA